MPKATKCLMQQNALQTKCLTDKMPKVTYIYCLKRQTAECDRIPERNGVTYIPVHDENNDTMMMPFYLMHESKVKLQHEADLPHE